MTASDRDPGFDERAIELIADRVAALLREELEAIATDLANTRRSERPLTVDDVAKRFGVARSTVYSHWREWGGYKLGQGEKAAIRFAQEALPEYAPEAGRTKAGTQEERGPKKRRRPRRELLRPRPRFPSEAAAETLAPPRGHIHESEH